MNVLKRLTEITELAKSELAEEAGLRGRVYNLFEQDIPPERRVLLDRVAAELERVYAGKKFSRLVYDAFKRKVLHEQEIGAH